MARTTITKDGSYDVNLFNFNRRMNATISYDYQPDVHERDKQTHYADRIDYYYREQSGAEGYLRIGGTDLTIDENGTLTNGLITSFTEYVKIDGVYRETSRTEGIKVSASTFVSATRSPDTTDDFAFLSQTLFGGDDIFESNATVDTNEHFKGYAGDDTIYAYGGDDILDGGDGHDVLDGGSGADTLYGGRGNDTYFVDHEQDVIDERLSETNSNDAGSIRDQVRSTISWTLRPTLENLTLIGNTSINGTGNQTHNLMRGNVGNNSLAGENGNDTLTGGDGADTLLGGAGDDILDGGTGADSMTGGAGNDTYYVDSTNDEILEFVGQGADTVIASTRSWVLDKHFETLVLIKQAIAGTGNALANSLTGNTHDNQLDGQDGNDILNGGLGNDTLIGANGNDTLNGGEGGDSLVGGTGDDHYIVDSPTDIIMEAASGGTDQISSSVDLSLEELVHVENLSLIGAASSGRGNNGANRLTGNTLANHLTGMAGADSLRGEAGNDTLIGGDGNDTLDGGQGVDEMIGGSGSDVYYVDSISDRILESEDTLSIDTLIAQIDVLMHENIENAESSRQFLFTGRKITGNNLDNRIIGNEGGDHLLGMSGRDSLFGDVGSDTLNGGEGDDTLSGGVGRDSLVGGNGNDRLSGDRDIDTLDGGSGNDTYVQPDSNDTIIELSGGGIDTIETISSFSLAKYEQIENLTMLAIQNSNGTRTGTGNAANNILSGANARETLLGLDGDDTLTGGLGADSLDGGAGADLYRYEIFNNSTTDSSISNSSAATASALGIDTVNVTSGDRFDFAGVTEVFDNAAGSGAVRIQIGQSGTQTRGSDLLVAIRIAIDESANEVFLFNVNDIGSTAAFSGNYLIQTRDAEFSSNDFMIKLVGTTVDASDSLAIVDGVVVYNA